MAKMANGREPYVEKSKIILYDLGFELIDKDGHPHPVFWSNVGRINAYKVDLFAYDLICFEFHLLDKKAVLEVNEEMEGFDLLLKTLPGRFEGFDTEWWSKVVHPAFATNFTELWKRRVAATVA
jgi:hypothetical protein